MSFKKIFLWPMWPYGTMNAPLIVLVYRLLIPFPLMVAGLLISSLGGALMINTPVMERKKSAIEWVEHVMMSTFKIRPTPRE